MRKVLIKFLMVAISTSPLWPQAKLSVHWEDLTAAEFHRLAAGAATHRSRTSASSVWQVFDGTGSVRLNDSEHPLERGDIVAVPAWTEFSLTAETQLDLFTFSDTPVFEKLNLLRTETS